MKEKSPLLIEGRGLVKEFPAGRKKIHAVSGVDIALRQGETLALVGESGCGKSTLGRTLIRLTEPDAGTILYRGTDITALRGAALAPYRRQMQFVFQDPYAALDPRMTVRDIVAEPLEAWRVCAGKKETAEEVKALLAAVGLPENDLTRYPHQFSGGQRQRVGIARALALHPALVVCDEPVSALDVSVQNQILNLLNEIQARYGLTYLFISHDLSVVRFVADRVCVMFLGKLCEEGDAAEIFDHPEHPYTQFLLRAAPGLDPRARAAETPILEGELPSPADPPAGCRFHTRCPYADARCSGETPALRGGGSHRVACHRAE
ncbi:MAG: ABC transporter ATP-binding protein [Oscillospiraceae bacterium]|nr:ABC transporter ATP-binding protein [Oscillospiraceae bacterium]